MRVFQTGPGGMIPPHLSSTRCAGYVLRLLGRITAFVSRLCFVSDGTWVVDVKAAQILSRKRDLTIWLPWVAVVRVSLTLGDARAQSSYVREVVCDDGTVAMQFHDACEEGHLPPRRSKKVILAYVRDEGEEEGCAATKATAVRLQPPPSWPRSRSATRRERERSLAAGGGGGGGGGGARRRIDLSQFFNKRLNDFLRPDPRLTLGVVFSLLRAHGLMPRNEVGPSPAPRKCLCVVLSDMSELRFDDPLSVVKF